MPSCKQPPKYDPVNTGFFAQNKQLITYNMTLDKYQIGKRTWSLKTENLRWAQALMGLCSFLRQIFLIINDIMILLWVLVTTQLACAIWKFS